MSVERYRNRVQPKLLRVRCGDLVPDPRNWRRHHERQSRMVESLLGELGWIDALIVRETPHGLMLVDGHLRAGISPDEVVPAIVVDLDTDEAGQVLATLDPIGSMAETDMRALEAVVRDIRDTSRGVLSTVSNLLDVNGSDEAGDHQVVDSKQVVPGDVYNIRVRMPGRPSENEFSQAKTAEKSKRSLGSRLHPSPRPACRSPTPPERPAIPC